MPELSAFEGLILLDPHRLSLSRHASDLPGPIRCHKFIIESKIELDVTNLAITVSTDADKEILHDLAKPIWSESFMKVQADSRCNCWSEEGTCRSPRNICSWSAWT